MTATRREHHKGKEKRQHGKDAQPGVQKLKSALRQTRRLLAKKNLAANVRVESERRLKALEADLARSQSAKKERSFAVRYHKIKFFERQKVIRKLRQTLRRLSSPATNTELENTLFELRVDLNYILHYPKTRKYISLFPPEARHDDARPSSSSESEAAKTDRERQEIRSWIQEQMMRGELPREPEHDMGSTESPPMGETGQVRRATDKDDSYNKPGKTKDIYATPKVGAGDLESDEFFGEDNDDDIDEDSDQDG